MGSRPFEGRCRGQGSLVAMVSGPVSEMNLKARMSISLSYTSYNTNSSGEKVQGFGDKL